MAIHKHFVKNITSRAKNLATTVQILSAISQIYEEAIEAGLKYCLTNLNMKELNCESLMIGDWVLYKNEPIMVWEIDDYYDRINTEPDGYNAITCIDISEVKPIPLTAEILGKNFPTIEDGVTWNETADGGLFNIRVECDKYVEGIFKYAHELQHALRLCGINKEVEI